jgi:hypothetical protein
MIKQLLDGKKSRDAFLSESVNFESWLDSNRDNKELRNLYDEVKQSGEEISFEDWAYEYYTQLDPNSR